MLLFILVCVVTYLIWRILGTRQLDLARHSVDKLKQSVGQESQDNYAKRSAYHDTNQSVKACQDRGEPQSTKMIEETGQPREEVSIEELERDLVEAIENKDAERLEYIRNKAVGLSWGFKDMRLELMQNLVLDIESLISREDDYVPPDIGKYMQKVWEPSWWVDVEEAAAKWKKYHEDQAELRVLGQRVGLEDDFISFASFKPFPTIYWSDKREILLPVIIDYVSAKNMKTRRQVDIQTFSEGWGIADNGESPDVYFVGFCHLRNASRTFLSSRVESITVVKTGEILRDTNEFRNYLGTIYAESTEGQLDKFMGENGAEISEIVMFIGRAEGKVKPRVKAILLNKLSEMSGFAVEDIKSSNVCKRVFKEVGFDSRDFKQSLKTFGEKVYGNPSLYFQLHEILNEIVVDGRGKTDEIMSAMTKKILNKVAPPPQL